MKYIKFGKNLICLKEKKKINSFVKNEFKNITQE